MSAILLKADPAADDRESADVRFGAEVSPGSTSSGLTGEAADQQQIADDLAADYARELAALETAADNKAAPEHARVADDLPVDSSRDLPVPEAAAQDSSPYTEPGFGTDSVEKINPAIHAVAGAGVRELATLELTAARDSVSTATRLAADAVDRLQAADLAGAVVAVEQALKLQPLDPQIRALFRQVDERRRDVFYKQQHWQDLTIAAKAASEQGDIEAAISLLRGVDDSSTSTQQAQAHELYEQLRRELLLLEFALTTVWKRVAEGNRESARAICRTNLARYPYHQELRSVSEELEVPVPVRSENANVRIPSVPEPCSALSHATDEQLAAVRAQHVEAQTRLASGATTCPDPVDETSAARNFEVLIFVAQSTPRVGTIASAAKLAAEFKDAYPGALQTNLEELSNAAFALSDAAEQLKAGRLAQARAACDRYELCFPECYGFKHLRAEIDVAAACAATEYLELTCTRLESELDENRCLEILNEAHARYPNEPFYLRALGLSGKKAEPQREMPASANSATIPAPDVAQADLSELEIRRRLSAASMHAGPPPHAGAPSSPARLNPKALWMIASACGAIALLTLAVALYRPEQQTTERAVPSSSIRGVAAIGNLPVHVYSRVPVQVSVDAQRASESAAAGAHDLTLSSGEHLVVVSNPTGSASFLVSASDNHPNAQFYAAGLDVAVLVNHRLSISGPSLTPILLDGHPVGDSSSSDVEVPDLAVGRHELNTGKHVQTFDVAAGESVYVFIQPGSELPAVPSATRGKPAASPVSARITPSVAALTAPPTRTTSVQKSAPSAEQRHLTFQPKAVEVKAEPVQMSAPPSEQFDTAESPLPAGLIAPPPQQPKAPPRATGTNEQQDREEILARLREYTEAWRSRDVNRILAARPGVTKQSVQSALDGVVLLSMIILPSGPPAIQGDHARVDCIRRTSETYAGGRPTRSSNTKVVYYFVRRNGQWMIEGLR